MKESQELSACIVAFFNCRVELRSKLVGATRWTTVEKASHGVRRRS
jgi:hypothetical protein